MKVLVTGGAGYIGSHTAKALSQAGYEPIILDSLVYGHEWAVHWGELCKLDISDYSSLKSFFKSHPVDAVIHFAAFAYVGESVLQPLKYYDNNLKGTVSLLRAMQESGVRNIVFSSTCATYGIPKNVPIPETEPQNPINPYGKTKLMIEHVLRDLAHTGAMKAVCLRYFNAAGADPDLEIGEDHDPETHLIPLAIQAAYDPEKTLTVFGQDYATSDGTCVRDYIHVTDLARAHVLALEDLLLRRKQPFSVYNLGTGTGSSVMDVIRGVEKVSGRKVKVSFGERRPGDPPTLVASGELAKKELGWKPEWSNLDMILKTATEWYKKHHAQPDFLR